MVFSPVDQAKCIFCLLPLHPLPKFKEILSAFYTESPLQPTIRNLHKKFMETGIVLHKKCTMEDPQQVKKILRVFM